VKIIQVEKIYKQTKIMLQIAELLHEERFSTLFVFVKSADNFADFVDKNAQTSNKNCIYIFFTS